MLRKLVIFGDSISTTSVGEGGYQATLQRLLPEARISNHAVAESGASTRTPNHVLGVLDHYAADCSDADAVILWHGTNDWYWGSPIGQMGIAAPSTYLGALQLAANKIRSSKADTHLIFATPLFRFQAPDGCCTEGDARTTPNRLGLTLQAYEEAVRTAACLLDVRLAETARLSGFCRETMALYQPDHVHPNRAGCERLGHIFYDALL